MTRRRSAARARAEGTKRDSSAATSTAKTIEIAKGAPGDAEQTTPATVERLLGDPDSTAEGPTSRIQRDLEALVNQFRTRVIGS